MLFAIALPLRLVGTWFEETAVDTWGLGMLVIDVAVPFLFGGPSNLEVLASLVGALPRTGVRLLVFTGTGLALTQTQEG